MHSWVEEYFKIAGTDIIFLGSFCRELLTFEKYCNCFEDLPVGSAKNCTIMTLYFQM